MKVLATQETRASSAASEWAVAKERMTVPAKDPALRPGQESSSRPPANLPKGHDDTGKNGKYRKHHDKANLEVARNRIEALEEVVYTRKRRAVIRWRGGSYPLRVDQGTPCELCLFVGPQRTLH